MEQEGLGCNSRCGLAPRAGEGIRSRGVIWEHREVSDSFLTIAPPAVHPQPPFKSPASVWNKSLDKFPGLQCLATVKLTNRF